MEGPFFRQIEIVRPANMRIGKSVASYHLPQFRDGQFLHKRIDLASLCDHNHERPTNPFIVLGANPDFLSP
jgi:hypothetical protein